MKAKDILNEIVKRDKIIALKLEELERLRLMCDVRSVSYDTEKVQGSPIKENTAIIEYIQLKEDIDAYMAETFKLKRQIISALDKVDKDEYVSIIYSHYFFGKTFGNIALEMNVSDRRVLQMHGMALLELDKNIS